MTRRAWARWCNAWTASPRRVAAGCHAAATDLQHRWQRLAGPGRRVPRPNGRPLAAERQAGTPEATGSRRSTFPPTSTANATGRPACASRGRRRRLDGLHRQRPLAPLRSREQQQAFDLLRALREPGRRSTSSASPKVRERYGATPFGQSVLLARRLVEAGVRLVQVNWYRGPDEPPANPCWDSHAKEAARLKNVLAPTMDRAYSPRCWKTWPGAGCSTRLWSSAWPSSVARRG